MAEDSHAELFCKMPPPAFVDTARQTFALVFLGGRPIIGDLGHSEHHGVCRHVGRGVTSKHGEEFSFG